MAEFDARLPQLRTPSADEYLLGDHQLAVITDQRAAIESAKAEPVAPAIRPDGTLSIEVTLLQLVVIGINDATLLGTEVFYRYFQNRRKLVSWASGIVVRD
ncbi:MAG: hypothetical protein OXC62_17210 [Aestuariivita sp.]|nr:hypothetical protein [Aestuariivita sp.]